MRLRLLAILCAVAAALAAPALAHSEAAAPSLDPRVEAAWHEPAVVEPHTQWQGFLQLRTGADVVSASYQICRVGLACFAPPAQAVRDVDGALRFDTTDYTVAGPDGARPVDYQAGWRVGVKWLLTDAGGNTTSLPPSAHCAADAGAECLEAEYLAFDIASPASRSTPLGPLSLLGVAAALMVARRTHG